MFKNLKIYRLDGSLTPSALRDGLQTYPFTRCESSEAQSIGWIPFPEYGWVYLHSNSSALSALRTENKVLPSAVVKQAVAEKVIQIEQAQGYRPGRKQTREIKEDVILELLPKAFSQYYDTFVWLDFKNRWFVIDTSSNGVADVVLSALSKCFEVFPVSPVHTNLSCAGAMTDWLLNDEAPSGFSIDQDAELVARNSNRSTVKYLRQTLDPNEIKNHVENGKYVSKLALTWQDKISFVLTEDFDIRSVKPLDLLNESQDKTSKTASEMFEADFELMTGELSSLLCDLLNVLGERDDLV